MSDPMGLPEVTLEGVPFSGAITKPVKVAPLNVTVYVLPALHEVTTFDEESARRGTAHMVQATQAIEHGMPERIKLV